MKRPPGTTWTYWMEGDWVHVKVTREGRQLAHVVAKGSVEQSHQTALKLLKVA